MVVVRDDECAGDASDDEDVEGERHHKSDAQGAPRGLGRHGVAVIGDPRRRTATISSPSASCELSALALRPATSATSCTVVSSVPSDPSITPRTSEAASSAAAGHSRPAGALPKPDVSEESRERSDDRGAVLPPPTTASLVSDRSQSRRDDALLQRTLVRLARARGEIEQGVER